MSYGFVYILGNPVFPGVFKVGMTECSPSLRCKELSSSTAVPEPFVLVAYYEFENARMVEQEIHSLLHNHRVSGNREFFDLPLYGIVEHVRSFIPMTEYESYMVELSGRGMDPIVCSSRRLIGVLRD